MSDQPMSGDGGLEHRAARALNKTMVVALTAALMGLAIWGLIITVGPALAVINALPPEQHDKLDKLGSALLFGMIAVQAPWSALNWAFKRDGKA